MPLAFAYVPQRLSAPDSLVYVELLGNLYPATVLKEPPVMIEPMRERKRKTEEKKSSAL